MENKYLNEKEKGRIKGISKFLSVIFCIGRIFIYIAIVSMIVAAVFIPTIINNTKVNENEIKFNYKDNSLLIKKENNEIKIFANEDKVDTKLEVSVFNEINKYYSKYSNKQLIGYSESYILILIAYLYITSLFIKNVEKLFKNISNKKTPFNEENINLIKFSIKYKFIAMLIPFVGSIIFAAILKIGDPFTFMSFDIVELLVMVVVYYIFKYACQLQENSKETLFDK